MSNPAMIGEVDRLIAGLLLAEGGVFLPSVGSLYVERCPAKRLSKRSVLPPYRVVTFSSQQTGTSLIEAIARAIRVAGGDEGQAEAIYNRWFSYVQHDGSVTVGEVGVLQQKHFAVDPAFDKKLNPQGREPVAIKPLRRFDWAVWIGGAAIVFAAGIGGYQYLMTIPDPAAPALQPVERIDVQAPVAAQPEIPADLPADTLEDVADPAMPAKTKPAEQHAQQAVQPTPAQPGVLTAGRRYVVLGVFSTSENAQRAAGEARGKYTGMEFRVYLFGGKWMVSPFESGDAQACAEFIAENRSSLPELWTYTAR